jgi:hypothetical protein
MLIVIIPLWVALAVLSWPIRKIFPPQPMSAAEMVERLDYALTDGVDAEDVDEALFMASESRSDILALEPLQERIKKLGEAPLTVEEVDELKAIRESAQAIAAGVSA